MNMNTETHTDLKEYQAMVDTSATALLTVRANSAEEARQILTQSFGTDLALRRMQGSRRMLGLVSPDNVRDELEVVIGNAIWIRGKKNDTSMDHRETTFLLHAGDDYDLVCTEHPCCAEDCQTDGQCLLYLLNQPAERIPMSAIDACATELGKQLVHECIPDTALFITFNPCSILDVEDARYLIAPALVYGLEDNKPAPMTDVECAAIQKILAERTVTLTADGEEFHALKLWD